MKFLSYFFLGFLLSLGCSSRVKKVLPSPLTEASNSDQDSSQLEGQASFNAPKSLTNNETKASEWEQKYSAAKGSPADQSCPLFIELSGSEEFALNGLARLRAQLVCGEQTLSAHGISPLDFEKVEGWQKALVVDTMLAQAEASQNLNDLAFWAHEKSKFFMPTHEKLRWTERALEAAKALKDKQKIEQLSERREKLAPRFLQNPKREQWMDVASDWRRQRDFDKARTFYNKILQPKNGFEFNDQLQALQGLRMIDKNSRAKEDYVQSSERKARFVFDAYQKKRRDQKLQSKLQEVYIDLMRTYWTQGHLTKASQVLKFLERELKNKVNIGEVYWLRGRMSEEKQDFQQARSEFTRALKEKENSVDQKEKYLWHLGWTQRKLKNFSSAIETFRELKALTINEFQRAKFSFWLAESLNDHGNKEEARAEFVLLIEQDPLGYYGMMAHRQINEPLKKPIATESLDLLSERSPSSLSSIYDVALFEWLLRAEGSDLSQSYLDDVSSRYKSRSEQTSADWLTLFHAMARSGSYLRLFELLGQLPQDQRSQILKDWPEVLFPRPYLDLVKKAETEFGVGQDLIYAVMRQESAFNPVARSWADAFGLLQMLPEVARKMLPLGDLKTIQDEDLLRPEINIPLGAAFLKQLLKKYEGRFILTVAAYNASDRAIQGWIQTRFKGHTLEFIEDIPYEETKGYVKLVMRNLLFYRLLDSSETQLAFPEELLKI